jgi:cell division protein FtsL
MQAARQLSPQQTRGMQNRPYRHPVYQQDPQARIRRFKLVTLLLSCFLLSLVVVAQYSSLVMTNYSLSSAQKELAAIQDSTRQLELEVAKLSSVGVIEAIARTELGMVEPDLAQLRIITASRVLSASIGE